MGQLKKALSTPQHVTTLSCPTCNACHRFVGAVPQQTECRGCGTSYNPALLAARVFQKANVPLDVKVDLHGNIPKARDELEAMVKAKARDELEAMVKAVEFLRDNNEPSEVAHRGYPKLPTMTPRRMCKSLVGAATANVVHDMQRNANDVRKEDPRLAKVIDEARVAIERCIAYAHTKVETRK